VKKKQKECGDDNGGGSGVEGDRPSGELAAWRLLCRSDRRGGGAGGVLGALIRRVEAELGGDGRPTASQVVAWRGAAEALLRREAEIDVDATADAAGVVFVLIELVRARRASGWKLRVVGSDGVDGEAERAGGDRGAMLDVSGGEQATAWPIAAHVARRFVVAASALSGGSDVKVIDACCGVGGQSAELVRAGLRVLAVDLDAARAEMARWNSDGLADAVAGDVGGLDVRGRMVHIDPGRRVERGDRAGRRVFDLDGMRPTWDVVDGLLIKASDGGGGGSGGVGVKLGPGVDVVELAERSSVDGEVEFISLGGVLRQAMWWTGVLRDGRGRRATGIGMDGRVVYSIAGGRGESTLGASEIGRYVWTVDAAVERAGLLMELAGSVGARHVHPGLGLLTSDVLIGDGAEHAGALCGFEVLEVLPWRRERVREAVRALGGGVVEVKTRGKACDPDVEQRELRGDGDQALVVFVLRFGVRVRAIVARRV